MTEHISGVVIIGGGYAGLHAARAVADAGIAATVVDPSPRHSFVTRLAAIAGGTAPPRDADAPLAALAERVRTARVDTIDLDGVAVLGDGTRITADAMIVTVGAKPTAPPIPGLEHLAELRTADDALELRKRIADAPSVTILGGGPTGVQLAGSIAAAHPDTNVQLVERERMLLPGMHESLGAHARTILERRGVEVHLDTTMACADSDGLVLDDDDRIDGFGVWAGGFSARTEVVAGVGDDDRLTVDDCLRIAGSSTVFAAGDVAAHHDRAGDPLPMSAQIATQAGSAAGANAAAVVRGRSTEPARLVDRGWVLDLGGGQGVAHLVGVRLARPFLDRLPPLLHWAIDAKNLHQIAGLGGRRWLLDIGSVV